MKLILGAVMEGGKLEAFGFCSGETTHSTRNTYLFKYWETNKTKKKKIIIQVSLVFGFYPNDKFCR